MNSFNIGDKILKLRKENNITQEQLANMVGVTAGAVSKWENGNSTPDITLLAPLARALDTSLDVLLSFQKELSDADVSDIKGELTTIFLTEGYDNGILKSNKYLKEYPNSVSLKLSIAGLIQMYGMMSEDVTEDIMKDRLKYSLKLFYEVSKSDDSKYKASALFSVASLEMMLENYEKSEDALKELSSAFIDPMVIYPTLLERQGKNKEAEDLCKKMLLHYLNQGSAMLAVLSRLSKNDGDIEKSKLYLSALDYIQSKFKIGIGSAAYSYCKMYIEIDNKELAAKWFKKYIDEVISFPYDYSENPYFKDLKLEVGIDGQKAMRKRLISTLIDSDEFKALKGLIDYEAANCRLKETIK